MDAGMYAWYMHDLILVNCIAVLLQVKSFLSDLGRYPL